MSDNSFIIVFPDVRDAVAEGYAKSLHEALEGIDGVTVSRQPNADNTQDFGATLIVILGTPAAVAIAKGVAKGIEIWLKQRRGAKITIKRKDGQMVAEGLSDQEVANLARIFEEGTTHDPTNENG